MNENIPIETENLETAETEAPETFETVGIREDLFIQRMDSLENLLMVHSVGLALIAGCILALIVTEVFKRV